MKTNRYFLLITPSWLSGLLISLLSALTLLVIFIVTQNDRGIFGEITNGVLDTLQPIYQNITDTLAQNTIISNMPLLIFWSMVGAVVYVIGSQLFNAFTNTIVVDRTFFYANVSQDKFIKSIATSFGLRLVAVFIWVVYCSVFVKSIFPFAVDIVREAAFQPFLGSIPYFLYGFVVIWLSLHIHTVLFRLIALRARMLG